MRLDDHLDKVETFGFRREEFPLDYNGHTIHLLQNDARVTSDSRLQVHFTLYCANCDSEYTLRGRCHPSTEWTPQHLQDVKTAVIAHYVASGCQN